MAQISYFNCRALLITEKPTQYRTDFDYFLPTGQIACYYSGRFKERQGEYSMLPTKFDEMNKVLILSFAVFAMFFGSGNLVFPLAIGLENSSIYPFAFAGLFTTGILLPFMGYVCIVVNGSHSLPWFQKLGKYQGLSIFLLVAGLIGPFAVVPRCITVSHAAIEVLMPMNLILFSIGASFAIWLILYTETNIIDIIGKYLTPMLLLIVGAFIVLGIVMPGELTPVKNTPTQGFVGGLLQGYNTMDIFAAFAFSGLILNDSKIFLKTEDTSIIRKYTIYSGILGLMFLGLVYYGLGEVAARNTAMLKGQAPETFFMVLSEAIFGIYATYAVAISVSLACFTTALSLVRFFADALVRISNGKLTFKNSVTVSVIVSCVFACIGFSGIQALLVPIIQFVLPSLIVFAFFSLIRDLIGKDFVKAGFFSALAITAIYNLAG